MISIKQVETARHGLKWEVYVESNGVENTSLGRRFDTEEEANSYVKVLNADLSCVVCGDTATHIHPDGSGYCDEDWEEV